MTFIKFIVSKTHTLPDRFFISQWNNECIFSSGKSNCRVVAILFSRNLDFKIHNCISDPEGNYIICDLSVEDNKFTLINLYGPNKDTPIFFENIINAVETIGNTNLMICGDFNTIQEQKLHYYNTKILITKNHMRNFGNQGKL